MSEEIKNEGAEKVPEERVFQFTKREHADKEPEIIRVKESELDAQQLEATYQYLMMIFNGSPFKVQERFIDEIMTVVGSAVEAANEIVTPSKTIVDQNGQPVKSTLKKV